MALTLSSKGAALIRVTGGVDDVQASTYRDDSFEIVNVGRKKIVSVEIDIAGALFPDTVFDPVGLAGDTVARGLTFGETGGTGAVMPSSTLAPFDGAGGAAGYERMTVTFDARADNGFNPGERATFGVDIDPNSIRGLPQNPKDRDGADPRLNGWDIGGVSGAELIGSTITVTFGDGSKAAGVLAGDGSAAGAMALVSQTSPNAGITLTVNGVGPGGLTTYDGTGATILVDGPDGATARVTVVRGFIQPFDYIAPNGQTVDLDGAFAGEAFKANNALVVQTVEVKLSGAPKDVSGAISFDAPGGALAFPGDDALPLRVTAVVVDDQGQPVGPVADAVTATFAAGGGSGSGGGSGGDGGSGDGSGGGGSGSGEGSGGAGALAVFLIDADTDAIIAEITDGDAVALSAVRGRSVTISVEVRDGAGLDGAVESMTLDFQNGQATRTESVAPYALFGDRNGDFFGGLDLAAQDYTLAVGAFAADGGKGTKLADIDIGFTVVDDGAGGPPVDSLIFEGKAYALGSPGLTWDQARAEALAMGGDLATIGSAAENAFITERFSNAGLLWIGLNDVSEEDVFVWADGDAASYRNFRKGQPDGRAGEDYVAIATPAGEWIDAKAEGGWIYDGSRWVGGQTNFGVIEMDL